MRAIALASRNQKEIIRDPLTLLFGIGLPVIVMWLFSVMQKNMPFDLYSIEKLTPGVIVFSFSFITLFSGMLLGKDKSSSLLMRIFASPLKARDYIIGYLLPLLPIALFQIAVCFMTALVLGLPLTFNILTAIFVLTIIALLYIGFGLLFGTLFTDKQVGGIFAIFVNITTWLSGTWFEPDMIGGTFKIIAFLLPFSHAVDATRAALAGEYSTILFPLSIVIGYTVIIFFVSTQLFKKKMRG